MPSTSSPAVNPPEHNARLTRLEKLADQLDSRFKLFGIRFGWDSLLGLIPGVGDVAAAAPGAWIILESYRMGTRRRVLARMAANSAADVIIGGIPVFGDIFDVGFKANRRNIALLKREMARRILTTKETPHDRTTPIQRQIPR